MNLAQLTHTSEGLREDLDSGDHEFRGDFHSDNSSEQDAAQSITDEVEMDEEMKNIDDLSTGIDDASSAVEKIDEIQNHLNEGSSVSSMEMHSAQIAHKSLMRSLGLTHVVTSMESVGFCDRKQVLVATLESEKQGILQKIASGFKMAMEAIVSFIQNLFRNSWALLKYADYVQKKVDSLQNAQDPGLMMKASARALSVDGQAGMDSVQLLKKTAEQVITTSLRAADEINKLQFKYSEKQDLRLDNQTKLGLISVRKKDVDHTGYFTGDRTIILATGYALSSPIKEFIVVGKPAEEIKVATTGEMKTLLNDARDIIKGIKEIDGKKQFLKNAASRIAQYATQTLATYGRVVNKAAGELENNIGMIRGYRSYMQAIVGRLPLEAFKTAKAFIDYARHSVAHYKVAQ